MRVPTGWRSSNNLEKVWRRRGRGASTSHNPVCGMPLAGRPAGRVDVSGVGCLRCFRPEQAALLKLPNRTRRGDQKAYCYGDQQANHLLLPSRIARNKAFGGD